MLLTQAQEIAPSLSLSEIAFAAAKRKLDAILAYGAELKMVSYEDWWNVLTAGGAADARGQFVHPVCDENVIAGDVILPK